MRKIRENIWYVTDAELGKPFEKGPVEVSGLGTIFMDIADVNYCAEYRKLGYEPAFFVSPSTAMGGWFVVVSRQRAANVPPYVTG